MLLMMMSTNIVEAYVNKYDSVICWIRIQLHKELEQQMNGFKPNYHDDEQAN